MIARNVHTKEPALPSRRDRDKASATRTPLADLAGTLPERPEPTPEPDDDMLPESTATMPAESPETDTAPANVRSRPGARKSVRRDGSASVPRTIAEMQAASHHTTEGTTDALEEEERAAEEPPPAPVFIGTRPLLVTAAVIFAVLALPQPALDLIWQGIRLSTTTRAILDFVIVAASALAAVVLLVRAWRVAFHDVPAELHPVTILELWERRASSERRDGWVTGALGITAGFLVMLTLSVVLTALVRGFSALYAIPYLLIILVTKAIGAVIFVGYVQRGLFAVQSRTKATANTGLLYGVALALWNGLTLAVSHAPNPATVIPVYMMISLAVAFGAAWIRFRSGSLIAAVSFQLLLLLLGIAV